MGSRSVRARHACHSLWSVEYPAVWPAGTWSLPFLSNFSIKFHKSSYLDAAKTTAFIGRRGDAGAGETGGGGGGQKGSGRRGHSNEEAEGEEDSSRKSLGRVSTVVTGTAGDSDAGVCPAESCCTELPQGTVRSLLATLATLGVAPAMSTYSPTRLSLTRCSELFQHADLRRMGKERAEGRNHELGVEAGPR